MIVPGKHNNNGTINNAIATIRTVQNKILFII